MTKLHKSWHHLTYLERTWHNLMQLDTTWHNRTYAAMHKFCACYLKVPRVWISKICKVLSSIHTGQKDVLNKHVRSGQKGQLAEFPKRVIQRFSFSFHLIFLFYWPVCKTSFYDENTCCKKHGCPTSHIELQWVCFFRVSLAKGVHAYSYFILLKNMIWISTSVLLQI